MGNVESVYGGKSFDQAIVFFRQKLNVPTDHWDDLMGEMHGKGFMVAGAVKADLLADLRGAVDRAISSGTTLAEFRKDFSGIVERHGWVYKGGKNWRTKIIYGTNVRTAYQAGRYQQMKDPDVVKARPYWEYRHGDSVQPREQHLSWDGLVLPHDDPWWNTHYPPNGWGCKCRVLTRSDRDLNRMGKKTPDTAPEIKTRSWKDRDGVTRQVPVGIDPGFDYNAGQAKERSYKILADKFEALPYEISALLMEEFIAGPVFEQFFDGKIAGEFPVAVLSKTDRAALGSEAQTVWLSRATIDEHKLSHPEIGLPDYRHIPEIVAKGEVYKQGEERLIYLEEKDRLYRAALKRTHDHKENYYLTLFETDPGRADRQVRNKLERVR